MKRTGAIAAVFLTALTAAGVLWPYVRQVFDIPTAQGIATLFIIIISVYWIGSYIYEHRWRMFEFELRGEMKYNCYAVDHFTPWEEMCFTYFHLENMKANYVILKEIGKEEEAFLLKGAIDTVEKWFKTGYIDHEDFPEHLKGLLAGRKQQRL